MKITPNEQAFNLACYVIINDRVMLDGYSRKHQAKEISRVIRLVFGSFTFTSFELNAIANRAMRVCYDDEAA